MKYNVIYSDVCERAAAAADGNSNGVQTRAHTHTQHHSYDTFIMRIAHLLLNILSVFSQRNAEEAENAIYLIFATSYTLAASANAVAGNVQRFVQFKSAIFPYVTDSLNR